MKLRTHPKTVALLVEVAPEDLPHSYLKSFVRSVAFPLRVVYPQLGHSPCHLRDSPSMGGYPGWSRVYRNGQS